METSKCLAEFGFNLYKAQRQGFSLFLSPVSVFLALSMVYLGSVGDFEREMSQVMFHGMSKPQAEQSMQLLMKSIESRKTRYGSISFHTANRLYASKSTDILEQYRSALQKYLQADIETVDFGEVTKTCKNINGFVARKTEGRITRVVDSFETYMRLLIVNAIYFKAQWLTEFCEYETEDLPFYRQTGGPILLPTMKVEGPDFRYHDAGKYQVLAMPYTVTDYAMYIVLPRRMYTLDQIEDSLSAAELLDVFQRSKSAYVEVKLPRFQLENEAQLSGPLKKMGLGDLFDRTKANLSAIDPTQRLYLTSVVHKTVIKVDEIGTEAAAATALSCVTDSGVPRQIHQFNADRPFMFAIVNIPHNFILFLGRFTGQ